MPAVPRGQIIETLVWSFEDSGVSSHLLSGQRSNPARLLIVEPGAPLEVHIYIWTLTRGGRASLPNEYRVQMTGVRSPLPLNPSGPTLIMGYEPVLGVLAGFDTSMHYEFTPGSPSVQIHVEALRQALTDGLAFNRKHNGEIAAGIRPDHLMTYVFSADRIHRYGRIATDYGLLAKAVRGETVSESDMQRLSRPRKQTVQDVRRWSRDSRFRRLVLQAYEHRCAITGIQLRLVDAAHILPVGAPQSTDDVANGLALSPTYHRAYDRGLIFVDEQYRVRLNKSKANQLEKDKLGGGLADIQQALNQRIILPANSGLYPSKDLIRRANTFRQIA